MRIVNLIENTPGCPGCAYEHGLSFYVETPRHRLLFDTGASDAFAHNAERLGIDLKRVDTVVLSHGHYDHTGGIQTFAAINPHAAIYLRREADGAFYHGERYIGMDPAGLKLPQLIHPDGELCLDGELTLFSGAVGKRHRPESNLTLTKREADGTEHPDDFAHEQYLDIAQGQHHVLLSGCAHNGILNILDRYRDVLHRDPDVVISGFHMMKKTAYTPEEIGTIRAIASELSGMKTRFYTGHCTGEAAFDLMRSIMGEQLQAIHTGCEVEV